MHMHMMCTGLVKCPEGHKVVLVHWRFPHVCMHVDVDMKHCWHSCSLCLQITTAPSIIGLYAEMGCMQEWVVMSTWSELAIWL